MAAKLRFGVYELDCAAMELRKQGLLIRLQEQPLRILTILVERQGEIVTREELQQQVWGSTFVDFDQSLNKAVNRIREALQDDAGNPRFVETLPRRGYRFIAPVESKVSSTTATLPQAPAGPGSIVETSSTRPYLSPKVAFGSCIALALVAFATVAWLRQPRNTASREPRHLTSSGWSPVLSRDGKLVAYQSVGGGGPSHIWVQQTVGGEAVPITSGPDSDTAPDFSPDGTHVAFYSERNGGGIYITATLPGEPKFLVATPEVDFLRFSPLGDRLLYGYDRMVFTVGLDGVLPISLPLNQHFLQSGSSMWAPNGSDILFPGVRSSEPDGQVRWWKAAVTSGEAKVVSLPDVEKGEHIADAARAWFRDANGREWLVYSTEGNDIWKLWRIGISQGVTASGPDLVSSGEGTLGSGGSVSADGKIAYNLGSSNSSIYEVPINQRGQKVGPTLQLPLMVGRSHSTPSVSRDGKWMAYGSASGGGPGTVLLRDLTTGKDHFLDDKDHLAYWATSISPDGSRVAFERDCKNRFWRYFGRHPMPCVFMIAAVGGPAKQVCEGCTARGFSSDGSVSLMQEYNPSVLSKHKVVALDLRTGKVRDFLSLPDRPVVHAFFSWDDRWVVFKTTQPNLRVPFQIMIAPVRHFEAPARGDWVAVTDGLHADDKPQFSADGNTIYFTSTRDGYLCIWAQRLSPLTKHPVGAPFALEHFHNSAGRVGAQSQTLQDLSVARDKILIALPEEQIDIWIAQMP